MSEASDYKVSDRRRFSADGEPLEQTAAADPGATEQAPPEKTAAATAEDQQAQPSEKPAGPAGQPEAPAKSAKKPEDQRQPPPPPPASFELLVYSLVMQAEMSLHQGDGEQPADLPMARHAIDMIAILQEKAQGNLSLEEQRLLENSLTELRFRYVQRSEELSRPGGEG